MTSICYGRIYAGKLTRFIYSIGLFIRLNIENLIASP